MFLPSVQTFPLPATPGGSQARDWEGLTGTRRGLLSYYMFTHPEFLNHHPTSSHSILTSSHTYVSVKNGNMMNSSEVGHRKRNSVVLVFSGFLIWSSPPFFLSSSHTAHTLCGQTTLLNLPGDTILRVLPGLCMAFPLPRMPLPPCLPQNSLSILALSSPDSAKMLLLESCLTAHMCPIPCSTPGPTYPWALISQWCN